MAKFRLGKARKALMKIDKRAAKAVARRRDMLPLRASARLGKLGDQPPLLALSGATLAVGLFGGDRRLARAGARMIGAHLLATFAKDVAKHRIDRTRPRSANGDGDRKPKKGDSRAKEKTSFPSGHSAGAIAVARAFARDYPEHAAPALGAAGLISLAQIARHAHYPTDVVAGLATGLAAEKAVDVVWPAAR